MLKNICKGMIIGLANIIPGVSGGTLAVSMGIYDKLIHCVTHLFKEFKQSLIFLFPIFIGMGLAIVGSAFGISYLFVNYPLQTNLLFTGLILGSLPPIWKSIKGNSIRIGYLITAFLFFLLVAGLALLNGKEGANADLSFGFLNVIKLFLVGLVASATMVIPGVSGSMMLLLMRYYHPILESIQRFITAFFSFQITDMFAECLILVPFGIGVVIGIFAIAKIIEIIFEKYRLYAYWGILGLVLSSPVAILVVGGMPSIAPIGCVTGIIALVGGFAVAVKLGE